MPLSIPAAESLLRLSLVPGVGSQRLALLLRHFGSADRVLGAPPRELTGLGGLGAEIAQRIAEHAGPIGDAAVRRAIETLRREGAVVLTPDDAAFPDVFRALADPPFVLFAAGDLDLLHAPAVALVGTRAPTPYGRAATATLAGGVARAGYAVVSGFARGIDTAAHLAALEAGGATVAVLGHGIDSVYPPENRALFERVRAEGLLVTELPPGERPKAGNFPRRNRLIAALSRAVVVVEMGLKSGAQHTVSYALDSGREVLAVPGPIGAPSSAGTNQLIRDGARIVTSVEDVLEELEGVQRPRTLAATRTAGAQPTLPLLTDPQNRVVAALSPEAKHVDLLCVETGMGAGELLGLLLELELRGFVESLPARHFRRA